MKNRSGDEPDDHYQTPPDLYAELDLEFTFDFDPCPYHSDFDGLIIPWGKSNFINPPYNRQDKPKFIRKAFEEWKRGNTCVLLIPSATGTHDFHKYILPHAEIRFLHGRINFYKDGKPVLGNNGKPAKGKHDSMIVIFRAEKTT